MLSEESLMKNGDQKVLGLVLVFFGGCFFFFWPKSTL